MIDMGEVARRLSANAEAIRALGQTVSREQARWKPDPETWSMQEVMEHVYNEERLDFRKHLKDMLSAPRQPGAEHGQDEYVSVESYVQALEGFVVEREASLAWLAGLESPDWDTTAPDWPAASSFFPAGTISAGDVLVSWIEHDYLHLRQMIELQHAWNVKQAAPYSLDYAGGW
jgi:hypothetical protein